MDILRADVGIEHELKVNDESNGDDGHNQEHLNDNNNNYNLDPKSYHRFQLRAKQLKIDKLKERWLQALQKNNKKKSKKD